MSSCGCGSSCSCGSNCSCGKGKRNPDLGYTETAATTTAIIVGVAPVKTHFEEMGEISTEGGHGCKCGSSCTCNPCNC